LLVQIDIKKKEVYSFTLVHTQPQKSAMKSDFTHFTGWICLFLALSSLPSSGQQAGKVKAFSPPIDIPILLTSNYGEIRSAHFHAGVDMLVDPDNKVYAVKEGYISRISVTLNGYGKALYIAHPEGYTSVYGHLNAFSPEVEKYVKDQQYQKRRYVVDLYPEAGKFPVQQGQHIALSGNTGYSFGAHLHFEIRDSRGEIPLNVLKFGFPVADNRRPRINCLGIYPLSSQARVADSASRIIIPLKNNSERIVIAEPIRVWGKIGFGIETYDYLDGRENACSPLSVSLMVDDKSVSSFELDRIPFHKSSYVNSHIDYAEKVNSGRKIQKLWLDPNNKLGIYSSVVNRGICEFTDSLVHQVVIKVKDVAGNQTTLHFMVVGYFHDDTLRVKPDLKRVAAFYYDSLNVYETHDVRIAIPRDALFTNIDFQYKTEKAADTLFSDLHCIHDEGTPVRGSYIISVKPVNMPLSLTSKAMLVMIDRQNKISGQGGTYAKGFVTTRTGTFGRFAVAVDSIPPEIRPVSFVSKNRYAQNQVISFQISDNLSGISTYNGYIDGNWALFEYDAKNDLLFYRLDASRLAQNQEHSLELVITDKKDNIRKFKGRFYY